MFLRIQKHTKHEDFMKFNLKEFISKLIYPKHIKCIFCGDEINILNAYDICENCNKHLPRIVDNFCIRCGQPHPAEGSGICLSCSGTNFHFEKARSSLKFEGDVQKAIHKFKYARYKFLAQPFAEFLFDTLQSTDWDIDLISYVPLFPTREKNRGYNQSQLLAQELSKLTNIPTFDDIVRLRDTPSQTHLSKKERRKNVENCFKVNNKVAVKDKTILLIDDVFTTGSTCDEISKELKKHHAKEVYILTVAHANFKQKF